MLYVISDTFYGYYNFLDLIILISLFSGIFIIITKNPIISVLYLILLFSNISCYLIFIGIKFIGISYLLVYVGAVSILFLFILMLINIRVSELISDTSNNIPLAILVIIGFFIPFSQIIPAIRTENNYETFVNSIINNNPIIFVNSNNWEGIIIDITDIVSIGNVMYTTYFIWLLITSIILLLAMVGAIIITINSKN